MKRVYGHLKLFTFIFVKLWKNKKNNWKGFCKEFLKKLWKKINTWNIRCLVDETIGPAIQRPSVLYWRLSDFRWKTPWKDPSPIWTPIGGLSKGYFPGSSLTVLVYVLKKRAKVSNIIRIQRRKLVYVSEIGAFYCFFPFKRFGLLKQDTVVIR